MGAGKVKMVEMCSAVSRRLNSGGLLPRGYSISKFRCDPVNYCVNATLFLETTSPQHPLCCAISINESQLAEAYDPTDLLFVAIKQAQRAIEASLEEPEDEQ